jgi:hypothetical protein
MDSPVVIRGMFLNGTFVPTEPLPDAEGPAELIVHAQPASVASPSIYGALGKARRLRTAEELDTQVEEERAAWGGP